jgi:predicted acylesterase/phospholipase RssA
LVVAGGAGHMGSLYAAAVTVGRHRRIRRIGGTSAGGLVSLLVAFGVPERVGASLIQRALSKNQILDVDPRVWPTPALCGWNYIPRVVRETLGAGLRLGDAKIPVFVVVSDVYAGEPVILSSWGTPEVLVDEAARATSALWPIADMVPIPSRGTGNRPHIDGGFAINYAMDAFDDDPSVETIGIRMRSPHGQIVAARTARERFLAVARLLMWSQENAHLSGKNCSRTIEVDSPYDGLDFDQSPEEFKNRLLLGVKAASAYDWSQDRRCLP